jgi:hypothetical protein
MKKQFAWILCGTWFVGMGFVASMNACSGDDTLPKDSGPKDQTSGDTSKPDTGTPDTGTDGGPKDANTSDCKNVPEAAPFTTDSGPFCPFQGDGSTFGACLGTEHCCLPASGNSTCTPNGTACTFAKDAATNSDFQCNETNDCTTGQVCCENAGALIQQDPGCTMYDFVSGQKGTSCVQTSCPQGQAQVCGSNADCTGGKTCFPVNTKAMWLGVCVSADGGI